LEKYVDPQKVRNLCVDFFIQAKNEEHGLKQLLFEQPPRLMLISVAAVTARPLDVIAMDDVAVGIGTTTSVW
jgi:hypothetical protein